MNVINANGLGFHPIIFESTGFVHKHTRDYLITLAKRASERKSHRPSFIHISSKDYRCACRKEFPTPSIAEFIAMEAVPTWKRRIQVFVSVLCWKVSISAKFSNSDFLSSFRFIAAALWKFVTWFLLCSLIYDRHTFANFVVKDLSHLSLIFMLSVICEMPTIARHRLVSK